MTRRSEQLLLVVIVLLAFAVSWLHHRRTLNSALNRVRDELYDVSKKEGLYRREGMARDDGHDAALEDHEQRIEALEASDE